MQQDLFQLAQQLGKQLVAKGQKIVVAESCTGGLISKTLTDVAGSSVWFDRGFITYSNEAKIEMLGVLPETLEKDGAVSEQTAKEMAQGALLNSHSDIALAVTGIAGPGGGTKDKPVGLVYIGCALKGAEAEVERKIFSGNRNRVRQQTLQRVMDIAVEKGAE